MAEIINFGEKSYELKYNERTIELIENVTKQPFVATIAQTQGMLGLSQLRQYVANALYTTEGAKVSPQQGVEVYEALLKEKGYQFLTALVLSTVQRDCPFFFQES